MTNLTTPKNWTKSTVAKSATVIMGQSPDSRFVNEEEVGTSFLQGNAEFTNKHPVPINWVTKPTKLSKKDDILISVRAPVGEINIADKEYCIGRGLAAIRFIEIDNKFGWYAIEYHKDQLIRLSQGSTFTAIGSKDFSNFEIIYPSEISEQQAIANILSTIDEAITQSESLVRKYQSIKQGLMSDLLVRGVDENGELRPNFEEAPNLYHETELGWLPKGWDVVEIEKKLNRVIDYRGKTPHKSSDGIPLITAKNVREGYLDPEPREYIYADEFDTWMNRGIPSEGDVMFTTEAPLGNVARVPSYKLAVGQRIITLQAKQNELDASYLFWLLLEPLSKQRIQQKSTGSTALGIKSTVFVKIPFQFPRFPEQERIGAILNQVQIVIKEQEKQVEKLKLLKHGLMQDLLSGQVRVKVSL